MTNFLQVTGFNPLIISEPQGPQGPQGQPGPVGPTGPAGGVNSVDGQQGDVSLSGSYAPTSGSPNYAPAHVLKTSGDTTGATDLTNLNALIAAALPTAGTIVVTPGHYYFNNPIIVKGTNTGTANIPCPVPSIIALGGVGQIGDEPDLSAVIFEATSTFPVGSFLIDYQQAGTTYGNTGGQVKGITLRCNSRAAGMRLQGARQFDCGPLSILSPAAPVNPGDGATGGFSVTAITNGDGGAYSTFKQIVVDNAALDSFSEINTRAMNVYVNCQSLSATRNCYYLYGSDAEFHGCGYEQGQTAVYADLSTTSKFFGLHSYAGTASPLTGNAVVINGGVGSTGIQYAGPKFYGCEFGNAPAVGTAEQAGAVVNIKEYTASLSITAMFHGCLFFAHTNTTDWFYVEAGIGGAVQVTDCEFKGTPTTHPWNDLSGILEFARCTGLTVPTSGEVDSTGNLTLTSAWQDVPGATVTLYTPKGKLYVTAAFDMSLALAADMLGGALNVDGTVLTRQAYLTGSVQRLTVCQTWTVNLTAGSHTIKLQGERVTGTSASNYFNSIHTGFTYQFVSDAS